MTVRDAITSSGTPPRGDRRDGARAVGAFAALAAIVALELAVAPLASAGRAARITALVGLGATQVGVVLMFFMGLGREPRGLRLGVLLPLLLAPGFAVVLMLDAAFRAGVG